MIITEHWCHGGHMTKDLENHGKRPLVSTLSQLAKKPQHKKWEGWYWGQWKPEMDEDSEKDGG